MLAVTLDRDTGMGAFILAVVAVVLGSSAVFTWNRSKVRYGRNAAPINVQFFNQRRATRPPTLLAVLAAVAVSPQQVCLLSPNHPAG